MRVAHVGGEELAERAAQWLATDAQRAIAQRGRWLLGVSGGRTPGASFAALARRGDVCWPRVTIIQLDERIAPDGHADRNRVRQLESFAAAFDGGARFVGLAAGGDLVDSRRVEGSVRSLRVAAGDPPVLDVAQLGLGADGHTVSLFAGAPTLDARPGDFPVALTEAYSGRRRLTVTLPVLAAARRRLWLVSGSDKAEALDRLVAGDSSIPAGRVARLGSMVLASIDK